jgi:hypothetical protein
VRPAHSASRSDFNGGPGDTNPKSGSIEGSNDGITRTEIDRSEENSELNARGAIATFPIAERGSEWKMLRTPCKSLRFGFGFCTGERPLRPETMKASLPSSFSSFSRSSFIAARAARASPV